MDDPKGTLLRSRLALAATVAIAGLAAAGLGVGALTTGAGSAGAATGALDRQSPRAAPRSVASHEHSRDLAVPGMSEQELRKLETATLGPEHALQHAAMRRAPLEREPSPERVQQTQRLATAAAEEVGTPAEVGRWDFNATVALPIVAIHAAMLPTGKVMIFAFPQSPRQNSAQAWLWDPVTGEKVRKDPPLALDPKDGQMKPANIWCSGHTFTADGELVVFGGNLDFETASSTWKGLNKVYTFNPFSETWREQPDMRHGRWYPSGVRLADGRIPITSGLDESGQLDEFGQAAMNEDVELFTPPSAPGGLGTVELIGRTSDSDAALPPSGEFYPHMFAMPSGRTLVAGPEADQTWFMNDPGANSFTWTKAPPMSQRRLWGTAVPLPGGTNGSTKVMALGGTSFSLTPSTNSTEVFDEQNAGAGWRPAPSTVVGRGHANTVLLPDGSMAEVGGGVGRDNATPSPLHAANPEQLQVELWDPQTSEWRLGPAQAENRAYHSTALLLPDARMLSAGDEYHGGTASDTGEIYEPPYLFRGPRPTISSAPESIKVGAGFGVQTPNANVARAVLVAPGSVTHALDTNQRLVPLALTRRTGCVDLAAPPNVNSAPPGYYMLFLLNDQGVPSIAKFVKLRANGAAPAQCTTGPPPPDTDPPSSVQLTAPAGGSTVSGSVDITATAFDNVGVTAVQFKRDGQDLGSSDSSSPYSTTWQTGGVPNGTYTLTAVARDAAGNTTTSAPVSVTVRNIDTIPPSVSLTAPPNGSIVSETTPVTAAASDDRALRSVQFKLDGQNLGLPDTVAPYSLEWATRNAPNGIHDLTAVATDAADNAATASTVRVTVQNTPRVELPPTELPPIFPAPPPSTPAVTPPVTSSNPAPAIGRLRWVGTKISFRLSEAATVKLSFERKRAGHPAGTARYVKLGTRLTRKGKAGLNTVPFNARKRGFGAGRYRVIARATDLSGKRSLPARSSFRLVAPRS